MVASFKYYPVILREIVLPCNKLNVSVEISSIDQLQVEFPELHKIGFQIMSKIFEKICAYQAESDHDNDLQFKVLFATEVKNRFVLKAKLDEIQDLLESEFKTLQLRLTIMNKIVLLKQLISSFVNYWNSKLNEYETNRKKEERLSLVRNTKFPRLHSADVDQSNISTNKFVVKASTSHSRQNSDRSSITRELLEASYPNESDKISRDPSLISKEDDPIENLKIDQSLKIENIQNVNSEFSSRVSSFINSNEDLNVLVQDEELNCQKTDVKIDSYKTTIEKLASFDKSGSSESISSIVFGCTPGIKAGLGDEVILNSESDKENYEVVHCADQVNDVLEDQQSDDQQKTKEDGNNQEIKNQLTSSRLESKLTNLQAQSQAINLLRNQSAISQKKEQPIRQSVKSLINNFLSGPNASIVPDPFSNSQHYLLPMREKLPIVLDDNDIGSIIAYSLSTLDYEIKLHEILQSSITIQQKTRFTSTTVNNSNQIGAQLENQKESNLHDASNLSLTMSVGTNLKETQLNDNIDVQFSDSTKNYYCCIHFASQFRKLRADVLNTNLNNEPLNQSNLSTLLQQNSSAYQTSQQSNQQNLQAHQNEQNDFYFDTEEAFIRTISKTVEWVAKGGKSKASFSKTINDRFVIKVVRKADFQLFTQMAISYFEYMHRAISECKPTLFAKIIGAYNVSWKDNASNASMKKYVLVMENVFFDRKIKQKFDLKGSEKNRLATTKTSDDVLLDENLTKIIRDNPFYIRNHSKIVLQEAIDNDSKFLCDLNVIDYSLLVGIDEEKKELVVAIIDYIQTYTSIKKLETVIKSMGNIGTRGLPTVIDPQSYMIRFQNKMDQYFQCLPDQWYGLVYSLN